MLILCLFDEMASPIPDRIQDTRKRLDRCWEVDLCWDKYPEFLKQVSNYIKEYFSLAMALCVLTPNDINFINLLYMKS